MYCVASQQLLTGKRAKSQQQTKGEVLCINKLTETKNFQKIKGNINSRNNQHKENKCRKITIVTSQSTNVVWGQSCNKQGQSGVQTK